MSENVCGIDLQGTEPQYRVGKVDEMSRLYQFDVHMHTAETSKCGRIPAADLVDRYKAAGYDGIIITDHLHQEYISLLYCYDDWDTCVDRFLDGYRRAKKRGDEVGIQVLLAAELRFAENDNDYLVYGIDEAWLRAHPYPFRMGPVEFFQRFQDDLLIVQAHPFRDGNRFVRLDCVHGLEVVNTKISTRHLWRPFAINPTFILSAAPTPTARGRSAPLGCCWSNR